MIVEVNAESIKELRTKYKISQQTLAMLLGIGEASIVRYENGQVPSKANANLIRAAENPVFMQECLQISGSMLPVEVRTKVEEVVYALVSLDETGEERPKRDMNAEYEITLQQEILNEKAAGIQGELMAAVFDCEEGSTERKFAESMFSYVSRVKRDLIREENSNNESLAELRGKLEACQDLLVLFNREEA